MLTPFDVAVKFGRMTHYGNGKVSRGPVPPHGQWQIFAIYVKLFDTELLNVA